jgi:hypothetical protein
VTRPRPSRKARWTIGLSLTILFALVASITTLTALVQSVDGGALASDYPPALDRSAQGTVLDVDYFTIDDEPILDDDDGGYDYVMVDVRYQVWDDYQQTDRTDVVTAEWDSSDPVPAVGDKIGIRYRSVDPEYLPALGSQFGPDPAAPPFPTADSVNRAGPISSGLRWTIVTSWLLTLVSLIGTALWARRAQPAEPAPAVWGQPSWGQPSWGQPGWPPTNGVELGTPPGWSQPQQYPQPQYAQPSDQQPRYGQQPSEQPHYGKLQPSPSSELPATPAPSAPVPSGLAPSTPPPAGLVPPG